MSKQRVYVLVETHDHSFRGVFGNMDALLAMVDDERERDLDGWQYGLTQYLDLHFTVVNTEIQGEPDL